MTVNIPDVVDRLGIPESIDWTDPIALNYGSCTVYLPRNPDAGSPLIAVHAPDLLTLIDLLNGHAQYASPGPAPANGNIE